MQDKYCYPGSDILINLLDIQDAVLLAQAEADFTAERYRTYQATHLELNDFNLAHLKQLHRHLFQDIYEWAGELRDVDISKGETRFCTWSRISPEADKLFKNIPALAKLDSKDGIVTAVAHLFCETNLLHPFREGNGRVQRFFFEEMLFTLGFDLVWPRISQQHWIEANVAGVNLDLSKLEGIFSQALSRRIP